MAEEKDTELLDGIAEEDYKYGFTSDIATDIMAAGLNEDVVRMISARSAHAAPRAKVPPHPHGFRGRWPMPACASFSIPSS